MNIEGEDLADVEDNDDGVKNEVVAVFKEMSKEERQDILSELLSQYCPECGDVHAVCVCEDTVIVANETDDVDIGSEDDLGEGELDEEEEAELE
jgi:uncharacterized protein (UPF0212 family)